MEENMKGVGMGYYLRRLDGNIWSGGFSSFPETKIIAACSARLGGVSRAPYNALNLAFHVGDEETAVWQNRQLFCRALFVDAARVVSPKQVHKNRVVRATAKEHLGCGAKDYASAIDDCDALITNEPNLPLLLCFADCVPLLFYDEEHGAIGIAHAGRAGTAQNIAARTVEAFGREFNSAPEDITVGIAPAVCRECYEVAAEVAAPFAEYADCVTAVTADKAHIDLPQVNRRQLIAAGVPAANIEMSNICTATESAWYFSYRAAAGQATGRMGVLMMIKERIFS